MSGRLEALEVRRQELVVSWKDLEILELVVVSVRQLVIVGLPLLRYCPYRTPTNLGKLFTSFGGFADQVCD